MNDPRNARTIQGADPRGNVFADLQPVLYAAESPVSGSYVQQSRTTATYADAFCALRGAHVLDLGCGYGTTTAALAEFAPARITAADNSAAMTELMRVVMMGDEDLDLWLRAKGAPAVLGDLYPATLAHLVRRRRDFQCGTFMRNGGQLRIETLSVLDISPERLGVFDVAVLNNVAHWPVNLQRTALQKEYPDASYEEITRMAFGRELAAIRSVLRTGGYAVLMEPKDFIMFDSEPRREADTEAHAMPANPVFIGFNTIFNRLLKERFGIERAVPKTSPLFSFSKLALWCAEAGFKLRAFSHIENYLDVDPIMWCYVRMPLWLGNVNISFEEKIALGKEVVRLAREEFPRERQEPICNQFFYIALELD